MRQWKVCGSTKKEMKVLYHKALVGGFHLNFVCSCVNFDTKYINLKNVLVLPVSGGTVKSHVEGT